MVTRIPSDGVVKYGLPFQPVRFALGLCQRFCQLSHRPRGRAEYSEKSETARAPIRHTN